jgi:hypothetical protein
MREQLGISVGPRPSPQPFRCPCPAEHESADSLFSHAGNDVVAEEANVIAVACPRNPFEQPRREHLREPERGAPPHRRPHAGQRLGLLLERLSQGVVVELFQ